MIKVTDVPLLPYMVYLMLNKTSPVADIIMSLPY